MKQLINKIQDWYLTKIKRYHKHNFISIEDGEVGTITYPRYRCTICGNILSLNKWQMADLPIDMKYKYEK